MGRRHWVRGAEERAGRRICESGLAAFLARAVLSNVDLVCDEKNSVGLQAGVN